MYSVDMKKIPLTQGKVALVDNGDFEWLNQWKWQGSSRYATRHDSRRMGRKLIFMHRLIMNAPKGKHIDHINGNCFDNQKINLRFATQTQNNWNARVRKDNSSGYKGIHYRAKYRDFVVYINVNGKRIHLRTYRKFEDAFMARKKAEKKYHGKFALSRRT